MKIARNIPQQLIVGQNPIWVAVLLTFMALVFAGIGLSIFIATKEPFGLMFTLSALIPVTLLFVLVRRVQLIFEADKNTLTIQRKSLRSASEVVHPLEEVASAEVETSYNDGTTMRRVTLIMTGQSAGRHPLTTSYTNVGNHQGVSDAINAWLKAYRAGLDSAATPA